jgi:hypothetical protein
MPKDLIADTVYQRLRHYMSVHLPSFFLSVKSFITAPIIRTLILLPKPNVFRVWDIVPLLFPLIQNNQCAVMFGSRLDSGWYDCFIVINTV